jgi:hypothetical protein
LWGAASLSHHVKSLNGGLEFAERGLTTCRTDLVNAGVPNAATNSPTSEKPSARTAFRHGERAPDDAQPANTRETKCPDIRNNQGLLSVFSYPMLSRRHRFSGFSDPAALRKSRTRMGCGPRRECALGEIRLFSTVQGGPIWRRAVLPPALLLGHSTPIFLLNAT